jgi:hypothetical protein
VFAFCGYCDEPLGPVTSSYLLLSREVFIVPFLKYAIPDENQKPQIHINSSHFMYHCYVL